MTTVSASIKAFYRGQIEALNEAGFKTTVVCAEDTQTRELLPAKRVQLKSTHRLTIGDNVYFATGVWLNAMGGITIEDEVVMGPYVVISTGTHAFKDNSVRFGGTIMEPVTIGRGTWLAAHATVRAGVKIGSGVLVAGNAAVCKDVPDNVIVGGVPAKVIGPRIDMDEEVRHSRF